MSGRGKDKGKRKRRLATDEELATNISNRHKKDRKQNGSVLGMFAGLRSAAAALIGGGVGAAAQAAPNHSDSDQMGSGDDERAGGDPEDDGEDEFVQPGGFEDGDGASEPEADRVELSPAPVNAARDPTSDDGPDFGEGDEDEEFSAADDDAGTMAIYLRAVRLRLDLSAVKAALHRSAGAPSYGLPPSASEVRSRTQNQARCRRRQCPCADVL